MKIVIIGNSGSGKTWLAKRLAAHTSAAVIHLDELFWAPDSFTKKRFDSEVSALISTATARDSWVAEGVFGNLAASCLDAADALIWLDPGWPVCQQRLLQRASESATHMGRHQTSAGLKELLEWASAYSARNNDCSFNGHQKLFDAFSGTRLYLDSETSANSLAESVRRNPKNEALRLVAEIRL